MKTACKYCGKEINVRPVRLRNSKNHYVYCSKLCQHKATRCKVICIICGKQFETWKSANRKFCSLKCRHKYPPWNKGKKWSAEVKAKLRASCPDRRGSRNPHYDHTLKNRACRICGQEFRPTKHQLNNGYGIYCSHTCYLKNRGETDIEKIIHKQLARLGIFYYSQYKIRFWTVDFYLPLHNLVIEADGSFWHSTPCAKRRDKAKTTFLINRKYKVLRLTDKQIKTKNFSIKKFICTYTT